MTDISRKALTDFCDKWIVAHINDEDKEFGFGWRKALEFVKTTFITESEREAKQNIVAIINDLELEYGHGTISIEKFRNLLADRIIEHFKSRDITSETVELECPKCGGFADREKDGIYCASDDCSWGKEQSRWQTLKES